MSKATTQPENLAVVAPKAEAEALIERISATGDLDRKRKVVRRDGVVEIPVCDHVPGLSVISQKNPEFYSRPKDLFDLLGEMAPEERDLLPRGWSILGEVIVVKIHPRLYRQRYKIGKALLEIYPRCRCVLSDLGIDGQLREPCREVIAGSGTETVHRENGVLFKMDPTRVMFSPGNLVERMRMGRLGRNERVLDMFAGIGYFSLPMAIHSRPREILAVELNPVAHRYLSENIRLNRVKKIVKPVLGDCAEVSPVAWADRVIMGLVGVTDRYLKTGIEALCPGGTLHYHQTVPSWLYPQELEKDVTTAAEDLGRHVEILGRIRVKKYAPGVVHGVLDARVH